MGDSKRGRMGDSRAATSSSELSSLPLYAPITSSRSCNLPSSVVMYSFRLSRNRRAPILFLYGVKRIKRDRRSARCPACNSQGGDR